MHPRNKIRLMAGIQIDPTLEKVTETKENVAKKVVNEAELDSVSEVTPTPRASEQTSTISDDYQDGDLMFYNNGVYIVVMSDPKTDMIGIIPAGLINASGAEKNRAVEMVKPDAEKCRKPTREEIDAFKASEAELAAVDDDMDIQFSAESEETDKNAKLDEFDVRAAEAGGRKYKADKLRQWRKEDKAANKTKKTKIKKGEESEEGCYEGDTLGARIKAKRVAESTHNYAPGNKVSHEDTVSSPINAVAQDQKSWANSLDPKMVKNEYTLQPENRGKESMTEESEKVKVPSKIKEALKTAIKEFRADAERQGSGHTGRENAQMMMDTADAFETILNHLEEGNVMDIKHAQIFASSLMGPMLHKLPDGVWDFISNGGQKRALKDYMLKVD